MVEADGKARAPLETQFLQDLGAGGEDLRLHGWAGRADDVDIALKELTVAPFGRSVGAVDGLHLVAFEEARQLAAILGDDARQRHGQVVAHAGIADAVLGGAVSQRALQLFATLEDAEDELVALVAILAEQRGQPLHGRRLQRLEAIALVDALDGFGDIVAAQHVQRQKIAHAAQRLGVDLGHRSLKSFGM